MKDYDDHTHRSGISLKILLKPHVNRDKLDSSMETLERFADNIGAWLDYDLELMTGHDEPNVCLVIEYERTRSPSAIGDETYNVFRDDEQAQRFLAGKLTQVKHLAEALELDVQVIGTYHETL